MVKKKQSIQKPKSRISRITIGRLFNLGNYEHIRYELTADVEKDGNAKQTLIDVMRILQSLEPIKKDYDTTRYENLLTKAPEELVEYEKENMPKWRESYLTYQSRKTIRDNVLRLFDSLGGVSKRVDAKLSWDDDGIPF
jgi:hypothetical protein